MYKKIILAMSILLASTVGHTETCPSVKDIRTQSLVGWKAYDSDDGSLLPAERIAQLATYVDQFALAEWVKAGPNSGAIHCYYRDKHGSDLEAYFAKEHFTLDNTQQAWYPVSGYMHCAASPNKCAFQNKTVPEQQLAKR